jgi:hypothetical protein
VGPRAGLDVVEKRKILRPCRDSNPRNPVVQPVAIPTELPRLFWWKNNIIKRMGKNAPSSGRH